MQVTSLLDLECKEQPAAIARPNLLRLRGKCFILTFPQCAVEKELALKRITENNWQKPIDFAIVSQEKHQSGDLHLHAVVKFQEAIDVRKSDYFDFISQKHGNYQASRSVTGSVQYVTKYGNYVTYNINVEEFLCKKDKAKAGTIAAKMIDDGKSLMEVKESNPGYFLLNKRKIEDYQAWIAKKNYKPAQIWQPLSLEIYSNANLKIAKWLNKNLFQKRPYGTKDLFIHGTTMLGKTSLILKLVKYCRIYHIPLTEDFYDLYEDSEFDLAVIDEFKGHKSIQWMNEWCQGSVMYLKRKGVAGYLKKNHLPTIIISNYSLDSCYSKAIAEHSNCLEPLKRRLKIIELKEPININL